MRASPLGSDRGPAASQAPDRPVFLFGPARLVAAAEGLDQPHGAGAGQIGIHPLEVPDRRDDPAEPHQGDGFLQTPNHRTTTGRPAGRGAFGQVGRVRIHSLNLRHDWRERKGDDVIFAQKLFTA